VKVQALVTPDGQCIYLSRVYRGATHDNAIFDRSEVAQFLTYQDERGRIQDKPIMGDLAYIVTNDQKAENGVLSRNRIIVENFFARWKCLLEIAGSKSRGELVRLEPIVRATIAMTNWYIRRHPLRRREEQAEDSSDWEGGEAVGRARGLEESGSDVPSLE
jgi:hypothetical protein